MERAEGQGWAEFSDRHGGSGRDAAPWLGWRQVRLDLAELGRVAGGTDCTAVGQAISRFGRRLGRETELRQIESQLSNVDSAEKPPLIKKRQ